MSGYNMFKACVVQVRHFKITSSLQVLFRRHPLREHAFASMNTIHRSIFTENIKPCQHTAHTQLPTHTVDCISILVGSDSARIAQRSITFAEHNDDGTAAPATGVGANGKHTQAFTC